MKKGRRNHSESFKAKVALEAIRGLKSTPRVTPPLILTGGTAGCR